MRDFYIRRQITHQTKTKHTMKKFIALILAAISLITTSCSTTHCSSAPPHLAGDWKMGGPYNIGMPCLILQADNYLTFVNEKGDKCRGVLQNQTEVIALDWEGGLTGILTNNATRINWRNGTWWVR
jgi:hypothetical protein